MQRYLVEISYRGTHYVGWQSQPNGIAVQSVLEDSLTRLLHIPTPIVGCGRTDSGVHASQYFFHFDSAEPLTDKKWYAFSKMLPRDIAYLGHEPVGDEMHARFSAVRRSYVYRIHTEKEPFLHGLSTRLFRANAYDQDEMEKCAALLLDYGSFETFCKTGSEERHKRCTLYQSEWVFEPEVWSYHVSANRFLRGMVRLIVGACLQVGLGKITIDEVRDALEQRVALERPLSAAAEGLYLCGVEYER